MSINKIISIVFFFCVFGANAQNINVKSFYSVPDDMTARVTAPVTDQNGDKCALIKIRTTEKGFVFDGDMLGITKISHEVGEYWVYVPPKARKITLKHQKLGVLDNYIYSEPIKEATVYVMELITGRITTTVEAIETIKQYVVISTTPSGADVYINNKYAGQTPFDKLMPLGNYNYRIEKSMYHNSAGVFSLTEDEKQIIEQNLQPNFGFAFISSSPEKGAEILINGQPTGLITPAKTERLKSGDYTITLRKDLYESVSERIQVNDGQTTNLNIDMSADFGSLKVNSNPTGAEIILDGNLLQQKTPCTILKVAKGMHILKLKRKWYEPKSVQVNVMNNETTELIQELMPIFGELKIITNPKADIYINKAKVGNGSYQGRQVEGYYTIEARLDKHHLQSREVNLIAGEVQQIQLDLRPKYGSLNVRTDPFNATIKLNGIKNGTSPNVIRDLLVGEYHVELSKDGFGTVVKNINIQENETTEINEKLPDGRKVTINSNPQGAELRIDGAIVGKTPYTSTLSFGSHEIQLVNGKRREMEQIQITQTGNDRFSFDVSEFCDYTLQKQGVKMEMVAVKGGTYFMGENVNAYKDYAPKHEIEIPDFFIGKYEVTVKQFSEFVKATAYVTEAERKGFSYLPGKREAREVKGINWRFNEKGKRYKVFGNEPVVHLSWWDAKAFSEWAGGRLLTEAEWEYAARGGIHKDPYKYAGSDVIVDVAWYDGSYEKEIHEVGRKKSNALGIYDMSGNVSEFCSDWYDRDYYANSPVFDPKGPLEGKYKVIRGGSFYFSKSGCEVIKRASVSSNISRSWHRGFRIAKDSKTAKIASRINTNEVKKTPNSYLYKATLKMEATIREEANVNSKVLKNKEKGEIVYILNKSEGIFYRVWVDGVVGYMSKSYL
ncbi:PEGA domain-containing protein [Marinifilum flexuosum]|uniref:Formylglycine-generating enzyme required for sulfatase activity n=1 Tax=Marinifilum flexuosum TaxID=1117708 RepID=A0A419X8U0_9BACT|nr:PEGA domain-containing protein [Marinifilum flexuosum]RKE04163.1 formylglycine-generating enzyme required for sulfatase activity [Marinifilum flexuosum]